MVIALYKPGSMFQNHEMNIFTKTAIILQYLTDVFNLII